MTAVATKKQEYVILVDENDKQIGLAEKLEAHQKNLLHRAFSVFIFRCHIPSGDPSHKKHARDDSRIEILLQQRALHKYHSPGLWTNTCCSHPRDGESVINAGERRLKEELGIATELKDLGWFQYNAHFENGLSEHEIDHVLVGSLAAESVITANPDEVNTWRWITVETLREELHAHPEQFTPWLLPALEIAVKSSR